MRCDYCGIPELSNDHNCVGCGAQKNQSPPGLIWPTRLPRDEAEKAQLEAETYRNKARIASMQTRERMVQAQRRKSDLRFMIVIVVLIIVVVFASLNKPWYFAFV